MKRGAVALLFVVAGVLHCGKTASVTELMVVVDTDLATPADVDEVEITVEGPNGSLSVTNAKVATGAPPFPVTLGVEAATPSDIATITVVGKKSNVGVVTRRAITGFVADDTRMLRASLCRSCENVSCVASQTCIQGSCLDATLTASALPSWSGAAPPGNGCNEIPPGVDAGPDGSALDGGADGGGGLGVDAGPCASPMPDVTDGGTFTLTTCGPTFSICGKTLPCGVVATRATSSKDYTVTSDEPDFWFGNRSADCLRHGGDGDTCSSGPGTRTGPISAGLDIIFCVAVGPCRTVTFTVTH